MSADRTSVQFWIAQDRQFYRYNRRALRQYVKYARRVAGDKQEIAYAAKPGESFGDGPDGERDAPSFGNMLPLAVRVLRGNLLWRNPRFLVPPSRGGGNSIFTPLLARIFGALLDDFAEETHLYLQQRLCLVDLLIGPYMVGKVTHDSDIAIDPTVVMDGREDAQQEDLKFETMGIGPRVGEDDYHPAHIEQHEMTLARWQRGQPKVPDSAIRYMKKHLAKHREAHNFGFGRVAETCRNQSVHFRRVNPLLYGYDVFDPQRPSWHRETFLMRIADIERNADFSSKAKKEVQPIRSYYATGEYMPNVPGTLQEFGEADGMARVHEYVDHVDEKVILFADGGTVPLQIRDYPLARTHPSGPYVVSSLFPHPLYETGVCLPYLTEANDDAHATLLGINTQAVMRSLPMQIANSRVFSPETLEKLRNGEIGELIMADQIPDGTTAGDHLSPAEPVEVPAQNVAMESLHRMLFEMHFGGQAMIGGGDHSETATASEVAQLARSTQADEIMSLCDDHMRRVAIEAAKYFMEFYPQQKVAEVYGDDALQPGGWPLDGFAERDIAYVNKISVIPGTSRRNNSAIEVKALQETYALMLQDPTVPPEELVEVRRRLCEANAIYGIDYDASMHYVMEQKMAAAAAGGGVGPQGAPGMQGGAMPRLSESSGSSAEDAQQGLTNAATGAGRLGPGPTTMRGQLHQFRQSGAENG